MKNYEKTIFKLLVGVVMLCGAMAVFAQQLPEIIWNKVAHNPPNPEFSRTDSIKFSPDGQLLYAGGGVQFSSQDVGSITTFAAADGTQLDATSLFFQIAAINELTLFANGQRLATAHNDVACNAYLTDCKYGYILYDPQTLIRLSVPVTDRIGVKTIDYSSADQLLAVGNFLYSNNILILDSNALSVIRTLPGHGGGTFSVRFSPDGQFLASGGGDGTVKIWRVSDSSLVRTFNFDPSNDVYSVAFSPDGQYIAAADTDY
ncbi:MAG: hypothetical protein ABI039_00120, partial [Vicinamibacterales bacterium]